MQQKLAVEKESQAAIAAQKSEVNLIINIFYSVLIFMMKMYISRLLQLFNDKKVHRQHSLLY